MFKINKSFFNRKTFCGTLDYIAP